MVIYKIYETFSTWKLFTYTVKQLSSISLVMSNNNGSYIHTVYVIVNVIWLYLRIYTVKMMSLLWLIIIINDYKCG